MSNRQSGPAALARTSLSTGLGLALLFSGGLLLGAAISGAADSGPPSDTDHQAPPPPSEVETTTPTLASSSGQLRVRGTVRSDCSRSEGVHRLTGATVEVKGRITSSKGGCESCCTGDPSMIFTDGFESGDGSGWTSLVGAGRS